MKYIEKVILYNFQSHGNTEIEFDNGLNIIVGPSDSGKTAILRGLKWALFNEPSGDYFIREGESECSVDVIFSDGTRIKRYRSKSKNIYFLYDQYNNEMKFEGFGTSVPEEIIESMGIQKILLDSDVLKSINISDQLESPFLLGERASTRANSIGRLVGVNIIDDALRESLRDSRNMSNAKKSIDDEIVERIKELSQYEYLDELSTRVNYIEELRNKIYEKDILLVKYRELLDKYIIITREKEKVIKKMERFSSIHVISDNVIKIIENINTHNSLHNKNEILKITNINKKKITDIIIALKNINKIENNLQSINQSINREQLLNNWKYKYNNVTLELIDLKPIVQSLSTLDIIQNNANFLTLNIRMYNKLTSINNEIQSLRKRLEIGNKYMDKFRYIDKVEISYYELITKIKCVLNLKTIINNHEINSEEIKKVKILYIKYKEVINKLLLDYEDLLLKLVICPLCFSNIDEDKICNIIKHYS